MNGLDEDDKIQFREVGNDDLEEWRPYLENNDMPLWTKTFEEYRENIHNTLKTKPDAAAGTIDLLPPPLRSFRLVDDIKYDKSITSKKVAVGGGVTRSVRRSLNCGHVIRLCVV